MRFYGKDRRVASVMVEVKRGLDMDEDTGDRLPRFQEGAGRIARARDALAGFGRS